MLLSKLDFTQEPSDGWTDGEEGLPFKMSVEEGVYLSL
jgi:hypothetical protein